MWTLPTAPRRSRLHLAQAQDSACWAAPVAKAREQEQQRHQPPRRPWIWPLSSLWPEGLSLPPSTSRARGVSGAQAAAQGPRVSKLQAHRTMALGRLPSALPVHFAKALQPGQGQEGPQPADQATRCDDLARGSRSPEAPVPGLRRSSLAAARGSTGIASTPALDADARDVCVGPAALHRLQLRLRLQIRIRLPEFLDWISSWTA